MSTSWISRKFRRQRQTFSPESHSIIYNPPISAHNSSRSEIETESVPQLRPRTKTTISAKGKNGATKTVITIRKYAKKSFLEKKRPVTPILAPAVVFTEPIEQLGIKTPVPSSPTRELAECPQLRSPGAKSVDSTDSLATLADDGLSLWGLPKIVEQHTEVPESETDYEITSSLELYGIDTAPFMDSRDLRKQQLIYTMRLIASHKLRQIRIERTRQETLRKECLEIERENQLRARYIPFFASWI